ncbi:MAG: hypothetical protein CO103_02065, partial [Chloroflexi bacterium CG_4_9_14_3_um_filter_45_9]
VQEAPEVQEVQEVQEEVVQEAPAGTQGFAEVIKRLDQTDANLRKLQNAIFAKSRIDSKEKKNKSVTSPAVQPVTGPVPNEIQPEVQAAQAADNVDWQLDYFRLKINEDHGVQLTREQAKSVAALTVQGVGISHAVKLVQGLDDGGEQKVKEHISLPKSPGSKVTPAAKDKFAELL